MRYLLEHFLLERNRHLRLTLADHGGDLLQLLRRQRLSFREHNWLALIELPSPETSVHTVRMRAYAEEAWPRTYGPHKRDGTVLSIDHRHDNRTSAIDPPNVPCSPPGCASTCLDQMPCAYRIFSVRISTSSCRIFSASGTNGGGFIPSGSRVGG